MKDASYRGVETKLNASISTIRDSNKKQSQLERWQFNPPNQEIPKVKAVESIVKDNEIQQN